VLALQLPQVTRTRDRGQGVSQKLEESSFR
jgi:hypothetical protein